MAVRGGGACEAAELEAAVRVGVGGEAIRVRGGGRGSEGQRRRRGQ